MRYYVHSRTTCIVDEVGYKRCDFRFAGSDGLSVREVTINRRLGRPTKESSDPLLYPLVVLALTTGMRRGEIMGITWKAVDFERKRILLHET